MMPRHFLIKTLCCCAFGLLPLQNTASAQAAPAARIDFGAPQVLAPGYVAATNETRFSPTQPFGWVSGQNLLLRDRPVAGISRRDFVFGSTPATFRVGGLKPGLYLLTVTAGDTDYGDHVTRLKVAGAPDLPLLSPAQNEFVTLKATVRVEGEAVDIAFDSPNNNWIVNAMSLEPAAQVLAPTLTSQVLAPASEWKPLGADPTKPLLDAFRRVPSPKNFAGTNLKRDDYLALIAGEIDFWKQHQNADGAIIDPYRKDEFQYSTPAFAHAAAALVAWKGRADLLEPAAKAMDWAVQTLSQRRAANGHEDFYPPMIAHALPLLKPRVSPERAAKWEAQIKGFEPSRIYRVGAGGSNWNLVALSGEFLFQKLGLRDGKDGFVERSLAAQGRHFGSDYGLYLEGPMAYDHFPRLWAADMLAAGYSGASAKPLDEALRRGAITSLFMQSPWGELPSGGRSAQHQWNEAEQCVTYEIYAARALKAGDRALASTYKRAAHLALASMRRWVRPSGEMQIVKNWVDPSARHAYEGYSAHSQYNLLPMSMLALAYAHAASTSSIAERPAPADVGGFAFEIPQLHKVFANAGGTYVELDTAADHHYDATGLIRMQMPNVPPQLLSDSLVADPAYNVGNKAGRITSAIGVSWQEGGVWKRLGELGAEEITKRELRNIQASPARVSFEVVYEGKLGGANRIVESYVITPARVELTTRVEGYNGPLRYEWPVLADNGKVPATIATQGKSVTVTQGGKGLSIEAAGADSVQVLEPRYANHNGWSRLARAEFARGGAVKLVIAAQ